MALQQITVPFEDSFDFGIGVESTNASPAGKAVQGAITQVTGAPAATVKWEISRIQDTHDLQTKLGVDVKGGYNAGPFASVNARFDFAQSQKIHNNSLFMATSATIVLGHRSINDPQLSPAAAAAWPWSRVRARF